MMINKPTSATKQACKQSAIEATIPSDILYKYISPLDLMVMASFSVSFICGERQVWRSRPQ